MISGVSLSTTTGGGGDGGHTHDHRQRGHGRQLRHHRRQRHADRLPGGLTVTANNASKVYGGTDPTLTYTASGTLYYGDMLLR